MIAARRLTKVLNGRPVLRGIDLAVSPGQCVVVVGPNGAGKSTLLRLLAGVLRPDGGEVMVAGVPAHQLSGDGRRRVSWLGHQPHLYEDLTGEENLQFWARIFGLPRWRPRIRALLERFGLRWSADEPVRTYSRGMVQRLALARALLHDPELLLWDEPFDGLDPAGVALLAGVLAELKGAGRTLVVVSHRPVEVAAVADRFLLLVGGRLRREWRGGPGLDRQALVAELQLGARRPTGVTAGPGPVGGGGTG